MYDRNQKNRDEKENQKWDIIQRILFNGLFPKGEVLLEADNLLLDLDSLLSILLSYELNELNQERRVEVAQSITSNLAMFLDKYMYDSKIVIYYNMEHYYKFTDIYPEWCLNRLNRYTHTSTIQFIKKFLIDKVEAISKIKPNISIQKCPDAPVLSIYKDINLNPDETYIIFSRDPHYICLLAYFDIRIWNGNDLIDRRSYLLIDKYPKVHYTLIPWYYTLAGMSRNEYKGVDGIGPQRAVKVINENKMKFIKTEIDDLNLSKNPVIVELIKKYKNIFYVKNLI